MGITAAYITNSYVFTAASIIIFAVLILCLKLKHSSVLYILIGMFIFYTVGCCEYLMVNALNANRFSGYLEKDVLISGVVASEADAREYKINYILKVKAIYISGEWKPVKGNILLTTLNNSN